MKSSGLISAGQPPFGLSPNGGAATDDRILTAGMAFGAGTEICFSYYEWRPLNSMSVNVILGTSDP